MIVAKEGRLCEVFAFDERTTPPGKWASVKYATGRPGGLAGFKTQIADSFGRDVRSRLAFEVVTPDGCYIRGTAGAVGRIWLKGIPYGTVQFRLPGYGTPIFSPPKTD